MIDELTNVGSEKGTPHNPDPVETDPTASQSAPPRAPTGSVEREKVGIRLDSGEVIEVNEQLHFYAQNSLLAHPLVSPATSYLGGLPPLFVIAGDKEVLRDEIIYSFVFIFQYRDMSDPRPAPTKQHTPKNTQ